jgi:hypothetical protein
MPTRYGILRLLEAILPIRMTKIRVESNLQETIVTYLSNLVVMLNKLGSITKTISEEAGCDVIADFSGVDKITTPAIITLIILRKLLANRRR